MAHLSAESALYCRIFIEGIFGIKPTGTKSFDISPKLPKNWNTMSLNKVVSFGSEHNILVERSGKEIKVTVTVPETGNKILKTIKEGQTASIVFE